MPPRRPLLLAVALVACDPGPATTASASASGASTGPAASTGEAPTSGVATTGGGSGGTTVSTGSTGHVPETSTGEPGTNTGEPGSTGGTGLLASTGEPGSTGSTGAPLEPAPDWELLDVNPGSATFEQPVSPRDHLEKVSGWYFTHAT